MTEPPIHLLDALASIEEQRRYVIGATVEEYLVPDEILNDAWHFCERAERTETYAKMTAEQRDAVGRLKDSLDRLGGCTDKYDRGNLADLIERDVCWAVMRNRAGEALVAFGCDIPA